MPRSPLAGERAKGQQDDEQRHQVLKDLRRRQRADALRGGRVLCGAQQEIVLPVGLQEYRRPCIGIDTFIDE